MHRFSLQSSTFLTVQGLAHEQPVSVWQQHDKAYSPAKITIKKVLWSPIHKLAIPHCFSLRSRQGLSFKVV